MSWLYILFYVFAATWPEEKKKVSKRLQAVFFFLFVLSLKPHLMKAKPASPVFICIIHPLTEFTCNGTSAIDATWPVEPPGVGLCNFGCLPSTFSQEHASLKATLEMPKSAPLVWLLKKKQLLTSGAFKAKPAPGQMCTGAVCWQRQSTGVDVRDVLLPITRR